MKAAGPARQLRRSPRSVPVPQFAEVLSLIGSWRDTAVVRAWASSQGRRAVFGLRVAGVQVPACSQLLILAGVRVGGVGGTDVEELLSKEVEKEHTEVAIQAGVRRDELEFLRQASDAKHLFASDYPIRAPTVSGIARALRFGPAGVRAWRKKTLETWRDAELRKQEVSLHASLPEDVERVVSGKRVLLFKRILRSIGYRDCEAVDLLVTGALVVGDLGDSHEFPPWRRDPKMSVQHLFAGAKTAQSLPELVPRQAATRNSMRL